MDDFFEIGYVIFIIVIFLFSIIKNMAKSKKQQPAPHQKAHPLNAPQRPATPQRPTADDFIERKLAELLGLDVPAAVPPKPQPVRPPVPPRETFRLIPSASPVAGGVNAADVQNERVLPGRKMNQQSFRERIIWAEILAPPRARRRGRAV
jgi:hypothetical protein